MAHVVKLTHPRIISDDEFAALKQTPVMSVLLDNRIRLSLPPGGANNGTSPEALFENSVKDWLRSNCSGFVYLKRSSAGLDVYFRSKTDASGFKLYWADRTWGD
ncbi:MAG: hypothetical protein EOP84_12525 [Verrucomicrobiaceae bacterium]|nr:MAG: hypothetical protein EOP84_12525 [Verrucomicrobiaceae bacterium]